MCSSSSILISEYNLLMASMLLYRSNFTSTIAVHFSSWHSTATWLCESTLKRATHEVVPQTWGFPTLYTTSCNGEHAHDHEELEESGIHWATTWTAQIIQCSDTHTTFFICLPFTQWNNSFPLGWGWKYISTILDIKTAWQKNYNRNFHNG